MPREQELADERVIVLTPEMQEAWADWEPLFEPDVPLTPRQCSFVKAAFMSGYLAALRTTVEQGERSR